MAKPKRKPLTRTSTVPRKTAPRKYRRRNILPLVAVTGAAGTAGLTSALPGYYRDAQGVLRDARGQVARFASRVRENPEDIEILNEMAPMVSAGHLGFTPDGLEEYVRDGFVYHAFATTPVFEDGYRMGTPIEELAVMAQENPAKFDRCVKAVQRRGGAANAYAVCTAAGTRNPSAGDRVMVQGKPGIVLSYGRATNHPWKVYTVRLDSGKTVEVHADRITPRRNPAAESDALYETFHGAPPNETLEIVETEHVHEHLAGLADLVSIVVKMEAGKRKGELFRMLAPDPETASPETIVHLTANEAGTQLYFTGGDQSLDLDALGFRESFTVRNDGESYEATDIKDLMVIGEIQKLTYRTQKAFDQFEVVDYFHKIGEDTKERPTLIYDTLNNRMKAAGGEYTIHFRGIVN